MIKLPTIDLAPDVSGKKVFVRGDIDVPLESQNSNGKSKILDDTRLKDIWPTIEFLLKQNCQVILAGHLGRPGGKVVPELSSRPIAQWFEDHVANGSNVTDGEFGGIGGFVVNHQLTVLENLRFDPREESNDEEFAKELAGLAEVYVNECFAVNERAHASVVGVPKFLLHFAGFRLSKELEMLGKVSENPVRPLVAIIGGAKLETKIPVISKMAGIADCVIVGGKLLAEIIVGSPIMAMEKVKLLRLTENGKDTTLESIDRYLPILQSAGTIVWNGPVGMVEDYTYQVGTRRLAEIIASSRAFKVLGGGDTVGIVDKLGLMDKFDWVSSGGGSMLKLLAGEVLPGVEAILN
jgi:phosphoglycerate kinase